MRRTFWTDKRVFITGHTGFKGGWLSLWLNSMGATIKGYALSPSTSPSFFAEACVGDSIESDINDIRDARALSHSLEQFRPDIVFHLAAQPLVRYSFAEPLETFDINVMGTLNLLEAIRAVDSVRVVVNVTTDKCYENNEWCWGYRETEAMGGHDPYSASKACSELLTSSYRRSFFSPETYPEHKCAIATARAGNVIGGGDWSVDRLVPDILRDLSNKTPVILRNPLATRPWQHVLEPLSGYLILAERLYDHGIEYAEPWNFGPEDTSAATVQVVVEEMISQWGDLASWRLDKQEHPHEARYLKLDCSKARSSLGWNNTWDLTTTLATVVEWHKAYLNDEDMHAVSLSEIEHYVEDMELHT